MRTPKIEALERTIDWLNNYIDNNASKDPDRLPALALATQASTKSILTQIKKIKLKNIDDSPINSNAWLAGFSDADSNFSINIHQRSNKNTTRVQLYYRLEIKQTYHKLDSQGNKISFFSIMSILAKFLNVNVLSRTRIIKEKEFYSFTVIAYNKESMFKISEYFNDYPLLSSKYLDYKDWQSILNKQKENPKTISYLEDALKVRKNFNRTRSTFT